MKVQFNMVTMKDGKINVEERPELSELLSQSMREHAENSVSNLFTKTKKERAMDLEPHWYSNEENSEFFTATLELMREVLTDEAKRDKVLQRISEGNKYGTFRRYKTQQPMLVKAYKTRKGAEQNTFWRNR